MRALESDKETKIPNKVQEQQEIVESSKQKSKTIDRDRGAQTDEHFSMPNSLSLPILVYTACINYEQPYVVNIKYVLCVSSGSPQSMPYMTLVYIFWDFQTCLTAVSLKCAIRGVYRI